MKVVSKIPFKNIFMLGVIYNKHVYTLFISTLYTEISIIQVPLKSKNDGFLFLYLTCTNIVTKAPNYSFC